MSSFCPVTGVRLSGVQELLVSLTSACVTGLLLPLFLCRQCNWYDWVAKQLEELGHTVFLKVQHTRCDATSDTRLFLTSVPLFRYSGYAGSICGPGIRLVALHSQQSEADSWDDRDRPLLWSGGSDEACGNN